MENIIEGMKVQRERERKYLYWLCHIPPLGAVSVQRMWEWAGSFERLYYIEGKELEQLGLLRADAVDCFVKSKGMFNACLEEYESLEERGIRFITILDEEYPQRLRRIQACPVGLFVKGGLPAEGVPSAAIIGARSCSNYGKQMAEYMGRVLGEKGIQIISGLAYGIDGAGHKGALDGGGMTYGILGCGINICYPKENFHLYEQMIAHGGVISEFNPGERPQSKNFPMRNRIISGLADVILVIEAREKSGSLITVEYGLDQGKEIYALPGRVTDALSSGCNQLIKSGAEILTSPYDVLEYFCLRYDKMLTVHEKSNNILAKNQKMVYSCLDLQPKFLEQIVKESSLSVSECMNILLELEMEGFAVQTSHQYYGKKL